eukprot:CAMPEP_0117444652 /NCGR_PEP_ID=MMETSP0759-20121206/5355_1 /TAXON_ID=63605 /ORGANISM="Percolomonas cosmopolitus, Strain WS" /LENGTH=474 /DNA_ID=CAMNT_0005236733 /DNA_START=471 /DNA_END=1895 /DNA_ORIENTATION=-
MRTKQEVHMFSQLLPMGFPRHKQRGSHPYHASNCSQWLFTQQNDEHMIQVNLPDKQFSLVLEKLSCLAQLHNTYLALNLAELHPTHKDTFFNAMMVLDRHGSIVAKYRKRNLYGNEVYLFQVGHDDHPLFTTDFGMRFGLMICFDLMFDMKRVHNFASEIDSWLVSSWWVNFPPQINAIQMQMAYAFNFGTQLFVSNAGNTWHSSGSGGYDGRHSHREVLASWYNPTDTPTTNSLFAPLRGASALETEIPETLIHTMESVSPLEQENLSTQPTENQSTHPSGSTLELNPEATQSETPRDVDFKTFTISSSLSNLHFEASATAGTIKCDVTFQIIRPTHEIHHVYAMYAISGGIWPVRSGDICGVIYCGSSEEQSFNASEMCDHTLTFKTMLQNAPIQFESIHLHTTFTNPVYGTFPLMAQNNMSLPHLEDFQMETMHDGREYSLHWNPQKETGDDHRGHDLSLSAFQILGLRDA